MKGYGITDKGRVRANNQDSFIGKTICDHSLMAVVCDGMGGAAGGAVASSIAKDVYATEIENMLSAYRSSNQKDGTPVVVIPRMMREAVRRCNEFTYGLSVGDKTLSGMGTTLVSALVYDGKVYVCNVGDSRAYAFYGSRAVQITKDHSYVQDLVDSGKMTAEEAQKSEQKNIITRAVGIEREVSTDTFITENSEELKYILLCSDGLSNYLTSEEMSKILSTPEDMMGFERKVRFMVDLANERGGKDNITVYLMDMSGK